MKAKKPIVPDVNKYSQFRNFFEAFFTQNKKANKNFSFRFLATKIGCSPSNLNDVFQGRRKLSLKNVLKLIDYLGLKGVRAERLLLLALFELNGIPAGKGNEFLALVDSSEQFGTLNDSPEDFLNAALVSRVVEYLNWREGRWDYKDFIARSRKGDKVDLSRLQSVIKELETNEIIRWDQDQKRYLILKEEIHFYRPSGSNDIVTSFIENFQSFLNEKLGNYSFYTGTIQIPKSREHEVKDQILSLRNFMAEIDRETRAALLPPDQKNVFDYSMHFYRSFRDDEDLEKIKR